MTDVLATCPCGAPIIRDPKRSRTSQRETRRKYCSRFCGGKYGGGLAIKAPDILGQCLVCGTDIVRNPRRSRHSERNRKYCTRACSGAARRGVPFPGTPRKPVVKPAPPVEPAAPVWRPPGWAPAPNVGKSSRRAR
jgi:hypothetical protein